MFPMELKIVQSVSVATHANSTASYLCVDANDPPVPVVVSDDPKWITWLAF